MNSIGVQLLSRADVVSLGLEPADVVEGGARGSC